MKLKIAGVFALSTVVAAAVGTSADFTAEADVAAGLHAGWQRQKAVRPARPATRRSPTVPVRGIGAA